MSVLLDWHWDQGQISWAPTDVDSSNSGSESDITVLVPTQHLLITQATLPTRQKNKVREALPYVLEDNLVDEVESTHFAIGNWQPEGTGLSVAVVAKGLMDSWMEHLAAAGVKIKQLQPDIFALPFVEQQWSVWIDSERALVRTGRESGFAVGPDNLAQILSRALQQAQISPQKIVVYAADEALELVLPEYSGDIEHRCSAGLTLTELSPRNAMTLGINLLQNTYSQQERLHQALRPWVPVAGVLFVALLLQLSLWITDVVQVRRQLITMDEQLMQLYHQTFPNDQNVRDPKRSMQSQLGAMQGGDLEAGMVYLLSRAAPILSKTPKLRLIQISYRSGVLEVAFEIDSVAALDKLKSQLEHSQLSAEIGSADKREGLVEARMRIKGQTS
jgi:general secretion pathway protein L